MMRYVSLTMLNTEGYSQVPVHGVKHTIALDVPAFQFQPGRVGLALVAQRAVFGRDDERAGLPSQVGRQQRGEVGIREVLRAP